MRNTIVVAAATALGLASTAAGISANCTQTIESIALSNASTCINVAGLVPFATLGANDSVIPPINNWLQGLCADTASPTFFTQTCTNATISAVATQLVNGCEEDLASFGIAESTIQALPGYISQYYDVALRAGCTKTVSNDTLCLTSELDTLQASLPASSGGTNLTFTNLESTFASILSNPSLEKAVACTSCVETIFAILEPSLSSNTSSEFESELDGICGSGFAATTTASGVIVATGTLATQTPTGGSGGSGKKSAADKVQIGHVVYGSVLASLGFSVVGAMML